MRHRPLYLNKKVRKHGIIHVFFLIKLDTIKVMKNIPVTLTEREIDQMPLFEKARKIMINKLLIEGKIDKEKYLSMINSSSLRKRVKLPEAVFEEEK